MTSKNDILVTVREKLLAEGMNYFAGVPQDLNADFKKQSGWMGVTSGTLAMEHGFDAAVPAAVVVGIIGYFGAKAGS